MPIVAILLMVESRGEIVVDSSLMIGYKIMAIRGRKVMGGET